MTEGEGAMRLITAAIVSVTAYNAVYSRGLGTTAMIMAGRNRKRLPGICIGVVYFTLLSCIAAWALKNVLRYSVDTPFLPLLYTEIIGVIYLATLVLARVIFRKKFPRIKKYVHVSGFNSVVMGTIFLSARECGSLGEYIFMGLCGGAGFCIAADMLSAVYDRLYSEDVPALFRGYPAVMIYTGLIAMAVYGLWA